MNDLDRGRFIGFIEGNMDNDSFKLLKETFPGFFEPSKTFSLSKLPSFIEALKNNRKIEAIKIYRDELGGDIKTAKDFVDSLTPSRPGDQNL